MRVQGESYNAVFLRYAPGKAISTKKHCLNDQIIANMRITYLQHEKILLISKNSIFMLQLDDLFLSCFCNFLPVVRCQ